MYICIMAKGLLAYLLLTADCRFCFHRVLIDIAFQFILL